MRTDGHALVGLALAQALYANNTQDLIAPALCVAGSVAPDVVMIPLWLIDKVKGRPPLLAMPKWSMDVTEIGHSLPLWTLVLLLSYLMSLNTIGVSLVISLWVIGLTIGIESHNIIDALTHNSPYWRDTDQTMLWPLCLVDRFKDTRLGSILGGMMGRGWDPRGTCGDIKLKTPEKLIDTGLVVLNAFLFWKLFF